MVANNFYNISSFKELKKLIKSPKDKFDAFFIFGSLKDEVHMHVFKEMVESGFVSYDELKKYCLEAKSDFKDWSIESRKVVKNVLNMHSYIEDLKNNPNKLSSQTVSRRKAMLADLLKYNPYDNMRDEIVKSLTPNYLRRHFGEMGESFESYPECIKPYFEIRYLNDGKYSIVVEKRDKVKSWKEATSPWVALDLIPESEKWEAFEYYLEHNPKLARTFVHHITGYGVTKVYKRYKDADLTKLSPQALETLNKILKAYVERKEFDERLKEKEKQAVVFEGDEFVFYDEFGRLKQYFEVGDGLIVQSMQDYVMIAQQFLELDLPLEAFCKKYKISSVYGFKQMLEVVSCLDGELKQQIDVKLELNKKQFMSTSMRMFYDILNENGDVAGVINSNKSDKRNMAFYLNLGDNIISYSEKYKFVKKMVNYYGLKLSLNNGRATEENINNMLTEKEVAFLFDEDMYSKLKTGAKIDVLNIFKDYIAKYRSVLESDVDNNYTRENMRNINLGLSKYANRFLRKRYMASCPGVGSKDGVEVKVTDDMVDMAQHYARVHKLYPCSYTIERIIKAIIDGEIVNDIEAVGEINMMRNAIIQDIKNCETIEEYMNKINQYSKNK